MPLTHKPFSLVCFIAAGIRGQRADPRRRARPASASVVRCPHQLLSTLDQEKSVIDFFFSFQMIAKSQKTTETVEKPGRKSTKVAARTPVSVALATGGGLNPTGQRAALVLQSACPGRPRGSQSPGILDPPPPQHLSHPWLTRYGSVC